MAHIIRFIWIMINVTPVIVVWLSWHVGSFLIRLYTVSPSQNPGLLANWTSGWMWLVLSISRCLLRVRIWLVRVLF